MLRISRVHVAPKIGLERRSSSLAYETSSSRFVITQRKPCIPRSSTANRLKSVADFEKIVI